MQRIVNVVIRHKSKFVDREYSYLTEEEIKPGTLVWVSFGKGDSPYEAVVMSGGEIGEEAAQGLKRVLRVEDFVVPALKLELAQWIKKMYLCSLNEALSLFIPKHREMSVIYDVFLIPSDESLIEQAILTERKTAKNKILLLQLLQEGEVNVSALQRELGKPLLETARKIEKSGAAYLERRRVNRIPQSNYKIRRDPIKLNEEQLLVTKNIRANIVNGVNTLLHGITGSGKTEVYIELIRDCLAKGKQAIVLVPEISLTPQTIARFRNVFGDRIAAFHSQISQGERKDQEDLIRSGAIDIVIGARSALFAPLDNPGLVVIDECHDDAYKSESSPKYDAVEVAKELCRLCGAGLVMGTATPTVEQYYDAVYGAVDLQVLKHREKGKLPQIEILDTFEEFKQKPDILLSDRAVEAIREEIAEKKQVIIFLNKRGFAATLSCNECNHTVSCPNCDISLTYHRAGEQMLCHYCGFSEPYTKKCKACGIGEYRYIGYGTQRLQEELAQRIPEASVLRLDRDTTREKGKHEEHLASFQAKQSDILIGTQMISKGLDFESVNLVVVLNADQGLRFPDYRSSEKTLGTILQVAGRAGRSESGGRVLVQTLDSANKIFDFIGRQDYSGYFWEEIKERQAFLYPPFSSLIKIQTASEREEDAAETAKKIKDAVEYFAKKRRKDFQPIGPTPNLIRRMEGKFRWQVFYKVQQDEDAKMLKSMLGYILSEKRNVVVARNTAVSVEINPKSLI